MAHEELVLGVFRLDPARRLLRRGDEPIELKPKALDILCALAAARGAVVTKDELMSQVWPGLVVEENNIQVHVSALRKILAKDASGTVHLVTVPGRGYRLLGVGSDRASVPLVGDSSTRRGPTVAVQGSDPLPDFNALFYPPCRCPRCGPARGAERQAVRRHG